MLTHERGQKVERMFPQVPDGECQFYHPVCSDIRSEPNSNTVTVHVEFQTDENGEIFIVPVES